MFKLMVTFAILFSTLLTTSHSLATVAALRNALSKFPNSANRSSSEALLETFNTALDKGQAAKSLKTAEIEQARAFIESPNLEVDGQAFVPRENAYPWQVQLFAAKLDLENMDHIDSLIRDFVAKFDINLNVEDGQQLTLYFDQISKAFEKADIDFPMEDLRALMYSHGMSAELSDTLLKEFHQLGDTGNTLKLISNPKFIVSQKTLGYFDALYEPGLDLGKIMTPSLLTKAYRAAEMTEDLIIREDRWSSLELLVARLNLLAAQGARVTDSGDIELSRLIDVFDQASTSDPQFGRWLENLLEG